MKAFIVVIIVSAIIGGFVGGELTDRTFLLTGAVIGALGVGGTLFGLGWFFTKQDAKKRSAAFDSFSGSILGGNQHIMYVAPLRWVKHSEEHRRRGQTQESWRVVP